GRVEPGHARLRKASRAWLGSTAMWLRPASQARRTPGTHGLAHRLHSPSGSARIVVQAPAEEPSMNQALWIAKTGLDAQQTRMSVVSNNLANTNTTGFK